MWFVQPRLDPDIRPLISAALGRLRWRPLAVARGDEIWLVGFADSLVVVANNAVRVIGWHEIRRASWDDRSSTLSWETVAGGDAARLSQAGELPALVSERFEASCVVSRVVSVPGGEVTLWVRQPLAGPGERFVEVVPGPGVLLSDPRVSVVVARVEAELRAEFG